MLWSQCFTLGIPGPRTVFFTLITAVVVGICTYTMLQTVRDLLRTPAPHRIWSIAPRDGARHVPWRDNNRAIGSLAGTLVNRWGRKTAARDWNGSAAAEGSPRFTRSTVAGSESSSTRCVVSAGIAFCTPRWRQSSYTRCRGRKRALGLPVHRDALARERDWAYRRSGISLDLQRASSDPHWGLHGGKLSHSDRIRLHLSHYYRHRVRGRGDIAAHSRR